MQLRIMAAGLAALLAVEVAAESPAEGAPSGEWQRLGLMRVRDMTHFGLARLDFLPAHAVVSTPGTLAVELNLSYQNTWARSDNVASYLEARGARRAPLSSSNISDILALPGDAYLVDGEYGLVDMTLHWRASSHISLYATLPFFVFNDGALDNVVETFHGQFGFSNAGREFLPLNRWQAIVKIRDLQMVMDSPPSNDIGDPVVGVRYALKQKPETWNLVLETAVKIPLQSTQTFVSSGATDYGMQVSLQKFLRRNAFYVTLSGVYYASDPLLAADQWIPTVVAGWETRLTTDLGLVLQVYNSRSTVQKTNLEELSADKLQATVGLQWLRRGNVFRFGITENLRNFNNTPDVGLTLSVARIFRNRAGTPD